MSDDAAAPLRILLSAENFEGLVAGKVVTSCSAGGLAVELILSDIGFGPMLVAIETAMRESMHRALDDDVRLRRLFPTSPP